MICIIFFMDRLMYFFSFFFQPVFYMSYFFLSIAKHLGPFDKNKYLIEKKITFKNLFSCFWLIKSGMIEANLKLRIICKSIMLINPSQGQNPSSVSFLSNILLNLCVLPFLSLACSFFSGEDALHAE